MKLHHEYVEYVVVADEDNDERFIVLNNAYNGLTGFVHSNPFIEKDIVSSGKLIMLPKDGKIAFCCFGNNSVDFKVYKSRGEEDAKLAISFFIPNELLRDNATTVNY